MKPELNYAERLGRRIRTGDAESLGMPTDQQVVAAVRAGDPEASLEWLDYLVAEAEAIATVYRMWLDAMLTFGRKHIGDFDEEVLCMTDVIGAPPRIAEPGEIAKDEIRRARKAIATGDPDSVAAALAALRRIHWRAHDAQADWCWALLTLFHRRLGEDRMEEVYRETLGKWFRTRYESLAGLTQRESFELAIEGMRAHFCGPSDDTHIDVEDHPDRWVMAFDPCGSGGRMRRGDPLRGQQPRTEAPYSFGFSEKAHDWTWGEENVCLYCAHCSMVNEILPIEMTGVPMRITEYPKEPGDKCRWTIYKSAELIPEAAYNRVGKRKPPDTTE